MYVKVSVGPLLVVWLQPVGQQLNSFTEFLNKFFHCRSNILIPGKVISELHLHFNCPLFLLPCVLCRKVMYSEQHLDSFFLSQHMFFCLSSA